MFFNHSFAARRKRDYEYLKRVTENKEIADNMASDIEKMKLHQAQATQAKLAQAQYSQQYIATANTTGYYTTNNTFGSYQYPSQGINQSVVPVGYNQYGAYPAAQPSYVFPLPSRMVLNARFMDAHGNVHDIAVDAAYTFLMDQISQSHISIAAMKPKPAVVKMVEGEFSLDEMGKAEEVIQEMEHGF